MGSYLLLAPKQSRDESRSTSGLDIDKGAEIVVLLSQTAALNCWQLRLDDEEELDGPAAMKMEGGGREHWLPPLSWADVDNISTITILFFYVLLLT